MNLQEFISFSRTQLSPIINFNGAVLYSSVKTLTIGNYYILGLNPGGLPESGESIESNIDNLPNYFENSYLDEKWDTEKKNYEIGKHPIQRGLSSLFNYLDYDLRKICSSNLIFYRSRNDREINLWEDGKLCWPVHEKILNSVNPKIIITIGNGPKSAFRFLCYKNNISFQNVKKFKSNHKGYSIKYFSININGVEKLILGLPHLSRYIIANDDSSLKWIKDKLEM